MRNRSRTQKIETTFGEITVFKEEAREGEAGGTELKKSFDKYKDSIIQEAKKEDEPQTESDNFFGFQETETKLKQTEIEKTNFIDEQFFNSSSQQERITDSECSVTKADISDEKDLNFIDKHYFAEEKEENFSKTTIKNVSKEEIGKEKDLNYIDQLTFRSDAEAIEESDKFIGSAVNFKKSKKKWKRKKVNNAEIPIIQSNKMIRDDEKNNKRIIKAGLEIKNPNQEIKKETESQHKQLLKEIPRWDHLTIDQAALIIQKNICYFNEEQGILAIDKPYGLPSVGGRGIHLTVAKLIRPLAKMLKIQDKLYMAHRLDDNTTGVMLFATDKSTASKLREMFDNRKIVKQYIAITKNIPNETTGEINIPLIQREVNGIYKTHLSPNFSDETKYVLDKPSSDNKDRKTAITKYRVLDKNFHTALLEIQPLTGVRHQIRAHLAYGLDCPILGDHKYSHNIKLAPQKLAMDTLERFNIRQSKARYVPMHLHAYRLILPEFHRNENVFISANLPLHFLNTLKRLRLKFF